MSSDVAALVVKRHAGGWDAIDAIETRWDGGRMDGRECDAWDWNIHIIMGYRSSRRLLVPAELGCDGEDGGEGDGVRVDVKAREAGAASEVKVDVGVGEGRGRGVAVRVCVGRRRAGGAVAGCMGKAAGDVRLGWQWMEAQGRGGRADGEAGVQGRREGGRVRATRGRVPPGEPEAVAREQLRGEGVPRAPWAAERVQHRTGDVLEPKGAREVGLRDADGRMQVERRRQDPPVRLHGDADGLGVQL